MIAVVVCLFLVHLNEDIIMTNASEDLSGRIEHTFSPLGQKIIKSEFFKWGSLTEYKIAIVQNLKIV